MNMNTNEETQVNPLGKTEPWRKWAVLLAVLMIGSITATTMYASGVIYVELLERFGESKAKTSLVVSLPSVLGSLFTPVSCSLVNRFSCRAVILAGAVLKTVADFCNAFAPNINVLLFTNGVIGGIGNSFTYPVTAVLLGFNFDKHRNFVISLSVAFVSLGMFAASPLTLKLLDTFSLGGTFMMFAALDAHYFIAAALCKTSTVELDVKRRRFADQTACSEKTETNACHSCLRFMNTIKLMCDVSVFKVIPYFLFQLSKVSWVLLMFICTVHLPNYAVIQGATEGQITLLMSCFSIGNGCGRFLAALIVTVGKLKDKLLLIRMFILAIVGIIAVLFPLYSHFDVSRYMFAFVVGLCTGVPNGMSAPITISLVGIERISNAHGFGFLFDGIGVLIGPPIAAFLFGQTGSYKYSFIFGGVACLLGCGFGSVAYVLQKREPKRRTRTQEVAVDDKNSDIEEETAELMKKG